MMKRNVLVWVMLGFVLCGVLCLADMKYASASETATVVTGGNALNLRSAVGTSSSVLQTIPNGAQITVLDQAAGTDANGTWYKVSYNGVEGYVVSSYVALGSQPATAGPSVSPAPPAATAGAEPTTPATAAPGTTPQPQKVTVYRTKTTYKKIKVAAKLKKQTTIRKNTSGKALLVKKKKVVLKKGKSVTIIAEKTVSGKKWFKIQFKSGGKTRKGYIKSTNVPAPLPPWDPLPP